jgi:succinate dehydrogenase subunit D
VVVGGVLAVARSHKPVIWALFAAGGTIAAFVIPVLILITCLAVPFGLLSAEALQYERILELLQQPLSKFITFAVLFPVLWHAAHRLRITAHDLGIRSDTLVAFVCYGIAAAGTLFMLLALFSI